MDRWYVLQSKPQKENLLYEQLCLREIKAYYPCIRVKPVNPRARKIKSYFPGYLFVHVDLENVGLSNLQWIPGACRLVTYGGEPASVSDAIVQAIRRNVDDLNRVGRDPFLDIKPGETVSILSGPFAGYRAIFDSRLKGSERVRVLLDMLQDRKIYAEFPTEQISRIKH